MKVIVIGGNFAGFSASIQIKRKLKEQAEVLLIDRNPDFLFMPSLIWVPTGRREVKNITIPRKAVLQRRGVNFLQAVALRIDPITRTVYTDAGEYTYDQLVIATGPKVNYDIAPGIREHACYIGTPNGAMLTREKLEAFKQNPGPIVIGATQQAGCMGAAYEFLFNVEKWLRDNKIRKKVDLYWVTPETYLGHFGIDGMPLGESMLKAFMKMFHIHYRTGVGIAEVTRDEVVLSTGERIASRFTMLMPPFTGVDLIQNSPALEAQSNGFIEVLSSYRHPKFENVWVAGLAVHVKPPFEIPGVPFGVPKTGFPSDETGKIVAENITRIARGRKDLKEKPWGRIPGLCIMDAGKKEVIILSNRLFKPRAFAIMLPNIFYDIGKVALEKYFLWKIKHGYAQLP
jgi:sulfide:quinone oxidoreductase